MAKFKQGESGNIAGRPPGAKNKVNAELRQRVSNFLDGNFEEITKAYKKLNPKDKMKFFTDLMPYVLPKLQNTSVEMNFEQLSETQLDAIIEKLLNKNTNGTANNN